MANGRPIRLVVNAGQVSDFIGSRALMNGLPLADSPSCHRDRWSLR
jgi:hypothetical protein